MSFWYRGPFTGSFTGSLVGDGTGLTGVPVDWDNISSRPSGIISSSSQINTGSFTGSFKGDGSNLTGLPEPPSKFSETQTTSSLSLLGGSLVLLSFSLPRGKTYNWNMHGKIDTNGVTPSGQGQMFLSNISTPRNMVCFFGDNNGSGNMDITGTQIFHYTGTYCMLMVGNKAYGNGEGIFHSHGFFTIGAGGGNVTVEATMLGLPSHTLYIRNVTMNINEVDT